MADIHHQILDSPYAHSLTLADYDPAAYALLQNALQPESAQQRQPSVRVTVPLCRALVYTPLRDSLHRVITIGPDKSSGELIGLETHELVAGKIIDTSVAKIFDANDRAAAFFMVEPAPGEDLPEGYHVGIALGWSALRQLTVRTGEWLSSKRGPKHQIFNPRAYLAAAGQLSPKQ